MIIVRTPKDELFNYTECEELYNQCRESIQDEEFEKILKDSYFYSFYIWQTGELLGCIYFYKRDDKLFLNGFAKRGHHLLNMECLKESLTWFDCDIYAEALHKESRICVLKCGFKRVKNNLFIYRRNK